MRILIATDAWRPQVNGVVRTYEHLAKQLEAMGHTVFFLTPEQFHTVPCPTYASIRLALPSRRICARFIDAARPDAIHIATEGPVGWMARSYCRRQAIPFTTCFHTSFPEYLAARTIIPKAMTHSVMRRFHNAGAGVMAATGSLVQHLRKEGYERVVPWSRGVDADTFRPRPVRRFGDYPVLLYVGRVAVEKNIEAFLALDVPGTKVVVGEGPALKGLEARYPRTIFAGLQTGKALAECYASADVFVFPSRTDTFGIVLLEAMASGLPIAAYPVMGPVDVVRRGVTGILDNDLSRAVSEAMTLDREVIRREALTFSWERTAEVFVTNLERALQCDPRPVSSARKTRLALSK